MALQDLTPQLRTRLSRMERAVGWFVMLAVALLVFGFAYYVYNAAERKGWFKTKAYYFTFTSSANGLKPGDPVTLMGLPVGRITRMEPMKPESPYNMYVEFELTDPYYGYMWTEGSLASVTPAGLLGSRALEVTKGTNGYPTYIFHPVRTMTFTEVRDLPDRTNWAFAEEISERNQTNLLVRPFQPLTNLQVVLSELKQDGYSNVHIMNISMKQSLMTGIWKDQEGWYEPYHKGDKYWLLSSESPAVSEQLQDLVAKVTDALPGIFNLTNELSRVLTNSAEVTSNLNVVALTARPAVSNLTATLAQLNQPGALGQWLLPPNILRQVEGTLTSANTALIGANTNLFLLASNLNRSLDNLAGITGNLNEQVVSNPTLLRGISDTVVHADQLIQGLKRFWLFRHLFPAGGSPNSQQPSPGSAAKPLASPKSKDH